ncbi:MAG: hypothetical protein Sapg2KO_13590 [Saprospiraceae bacterium]
MKYKINMRVLFQPLLLVASLLLFTQCEEEEAMIIDDTLRVLRQSIEGAEVQNGIIDVDTEASIELIFSHTLNTSGFESALSFTSSAGDADYTLDYSNTSSTVTFTMNTRLAYETVYTITVGTGTWGEGGEELRQPFSLSFTTAPFIPANVTLSSDGSPFEEAEGSATVLVNLSEEVSEDVTVNLSFEGDATKDSDFSVSAESVTIPSGELSASVTLTGIQDSELEGPEEVIVKITSLQNAEELTPQEVTLVITDDDLDSNGDGFPDQGFIINEVLYDPPGGDAGDANGDGTRSASADEFIEFVNDSTEEVDLSGFRLFDNTALGNNEPRHTFPDGTIIPPGGVYVLFGGGTPFGDFGTAQVGVSTSGNMNLSNGGDKITILDLDGNEFLTFDTETDGAGLDFGTDQSITRSPDINGPYTTHTIANSELIYSPGKFTDGNNFPSTMVDMGVGFVINEVLFDPPGGDAGDVNGDGTRSASADEFIEFVNDSQQAVDLSGFTLFDENNLASNEPRHVFPAGTIVPPGGVYVLFGGGTPTGNFGGAQVGVSTTGNMNLSNGGDKITILDTNGDVFLTFDTEVEGMGLSFGSDQSITRSPDLTGMFMLHTAVGNGATFSPGLKSDGTTF